MDQQKLIQNYMHTPNNLKRPRQINSAFFENTEKLDSNFKQGSLSISKASSCQHLHFQSQPSQINKKFSLKSLNQQMFDVKNEPNNVMRRNPSFSRVQSSETSRESQIIYKYQPDAQLLKKELMILRNKFDVKKHQYRKQIEDLKKQIILWERISEENQDKFSQYRQHMQRELFRTRQQLQSYMKKSSNEFKDKTPKSSLQTSFKISIARQQQLINTIKFLQDSNTQLTLEISHLQQERQTSQKQRQVIKELNDQKVQQLTFNIQNLKQKIQILQNFQAPISKVSVLEKQILELKDKNTSLQNQMKSILQVHQQIESDLLRVIEQDCQIDKDKSQDKQKDKKEKEYDRIKQKEYEKQKQKQKQREDDSFYKLSRSVSIVDTFQPLKFQCKQCENNRLDLLEMRRNVQILTTQSLHRAHQFQLGKQFLQNKIFELQQFAQKNQKQIINFKNQNTQYLKQIESLRNKEKYLSDVNLELEEKLWSMSQYKQNDQSKGALSSPHSTKCSSLQLNIYQQLDTKTKQLLVFKNQAINCTDLYIGKCRELDEKRKQFDKSLSQYQCKLQQLTVTIQGLNSQLKSQTQTSQEMIFFLKDELQRLQYNQSKHYPSDFDQILRLQIDEINSLHQTIKTKNEQILKLKQSKSQLQVSFANIKGELEIQKLKKISQIKNVQITLQINIQNLKNQLNLLKKSQGSMITKLKHLTQQCKNKDMFIQKYIKGKNIQGNYQIMLNDYKTITNMEQFRTNLHHELALIDKLQGEKIILMQSIKRLQDLNKMNQNGLGDRE